MCVKINMPKSIIIHPEHMIHDLGLKGADLLIYAFIFSVYNLTEKPVNINKTYLGDLFGYSKRCVIKVVAKMVKCGVLVYLGKGFIPAYFMCKGHEVKKVHPRVKKVHPNDNFNDKKKDRNKSLLEKEFEKIIVVAKTPWVYED